MPDERKAAWSSTGHVLVVAEVTDAVRDGAGDRFRADETSPTPFNI